jgi:hypothetical protein
MKINKFNKFIYIVFFAFLFLMNAKSLKAWTYEFIREELSWVKDKTGQVMCGYTNEISEFLSGVFGKTNNYIFIGFNTERGIWQIAAFPSFGATQMLSDSSSSNAVLPTTIMGKSDSNASIYYVSSNAKSLLENGKCPDEAYSDLKNEFICFGSLSLCNEKNQSANFLGSSILKETFSPTINELDAKFKAKLPGSSIPCSTARQFPESTMRDAYLAAGIDLPAGSGDKNLDLSKSPYFIQKFQEEAIKRYDLAVKQCSTEAIKDCNEITDTVEREKCLKIEEARDDIIADLRDDIYINKEDLTVIKTCEEIVGPNLKAFFKIVYTIIKIVATVLIVVLSMLDFVKATSSSEPDKDMKKAFTKFVKRIVIIVIIFVLPLLLEIIKAIWPTLDLTCIVG